MLSQTLKLNKEISEAQILFDKLQQAKKISYLKFISEKVGKEILIFKKDIITLARKDKEVLDIDINNPRISRDHHLKICIVENKVIAEDMNSAGGTYHRGTKITKTEIEDGDILDLAHCYRITVHICRGREIVQSTLVPGTIPSEMRIDQQDIAEHQKISGLFIEADDKNYVVVLGSVPIAFKSIGIVYEKSGNCQISVKDNVLLLSDT